jgi:hypothetical protein
MGDSTEDRINRLRDVTADQMRQLYRNLEEARTRKETVTENDVEYWLRPTLHLIFITLSGLAERLTGDRAAPASSPRRVALGPGHGRPRARTL